MAKGKQAKIEEQPSPVKSAKWGNEPQIDGGGPLSWRFSICDNDGPFCWNLIPAADAHAVMERMAAFEKLTWADILKSGCHPIEIHKLEKPALERLMAIGHD
ncbi:hypothetical protein FGG78_38120, partial [Thioclava sp. BHET1]